MANKNIPTVSIGIDRGFGSAKTYSDFIKNGAIESLVAPISEERALDLIENKNGDESVIILKSNDEYYLVGKSVAELEPDYGRRDLDRKRDGLNEQVLFKACLGVATKNLEEVKAVVVTGLPTADLDRLKDVYKEQILNDNKPYEFSIFIKGEEFKKKIHVIKTSIQNQPKGTVITVMNEKLQKDRNAKVGDIRFGIGDIGYNTTDLSRYEGKIISSGQKTNFSTFATEKIIAKIKKLIDDKFYTDKSEQDIINALKTGYIKRRGKDEDCKNEIIQGFTENAKILVKEIRSNWGSILDTIDEFILTGGILANEEFADILKKLFLEECEWEISIPENPQFANVKGFYLIAVSMSKKL